MTRLPPTEKLPLAVRKNLRDDWDNKKAEFEKDLSEVLGTTWTIEVNPNALYPYAKEGYSKDSLGSCIASYIESAIGRLREYEETFGDDGKAELNAIAHAHVLTIDVDEADRFTYCGVDVHEGQLRIIFQRDCLGTNIGSALDRDGLLKALNDAPAPAAGANGDSSALSFAARTAIRSEWDPKAEELRTKIADLLQQPDIKLVPNFEDTFAKLAVEQKRKGTSLSAEWESRLGPVTLAYFEGALNQLEYQKFGEDELLREGLLEAVSKNEIAFRIVDKLQFESYCEAVPADGVLYLQSQADTWQYNTNDAAYRLLDRL